jgi:PIN domain nuclease of toxin-antitoxin system
VTDAPLLDTHAWVWWVQGDARLGRHIIRKLDELPADDRPAISDISLWEVATLASLGRIEFPGMLEAWLAIAASPKTVRVLPVTPRIAAEVARLPDSFHRDPADRLIVATSRVHGLRLLTKDSAMAKSGLIRLWSAGAGPASSPKLSLPRIFELKALVESPEHEHAYFQDFEGTLGKNPGKLDAFLRLEAQLAHLDEASWQNLRLRASRHLVSTSREAGRGWQQLFDSLNEARAYGYLMRLGCTGVRFVPAADAQTPDLEALLDGDPVLCEVKTLNISDDQASKNQRVARGEIFVTKVATKLPEEFLGKKLAPTIARALSQLAAHDPSRLSRWIVYIVLNFDDWVGDYQVEYFRQIDGFLATHDTGGAQLVFVSASNNFQRTFTMRSAAVDQE